MKHDNQRWKLKGESRQQRKQRGQKPRCASVQLLRPAESSAGTAGWREARSSRSRHIPRTQACGRPHQVAAFSAPSYLSRAFLVPGAWHSPSQFLLSALLTLISGVSVSSQDLASLLPKGSAGGR